MNNKDLYHFLNMFKDKTLEIVNSIENNQLECLENLFFERQKIIDSINKLSYEKEEFIKIYKELDISTEEMKIKAFLDKSIFEVKNKRESLKNEILRLKNQKKINNKYSSIGYLDSMFVSKKY